MTDLIEQEIVEALTRCCNLWDEIQRKRAVKEAEELIGIESK